MLDAAGGGLRRAVRQAGQGHAGLDIDAIEKADLKSDGSAAVEEVFAEASKDKMSATRGRAGRCWGRWAGRGAGAAGAASAAGLHHGPRRPRLQVQLLAVMEVITTSPHWRRPPPGEQPLGCTVWATRTTSSIGRARRACQGYRQWTRGFVLRSWALREGFLGVSWRPGRRGAATTLPEGPASRGRRVPVRRGATGWPRTMARLDGCRPPGKRAGAAGRDGSWGRRRGVATHVLRAGCW